MAQTRAADGGRALRLQTVNAPFTIQGSFTMARRGGKQHRSTVTTGRGVARSTRRSPSRHKDPADPMQIGRFAAAGGGRSSCLSVRLSRL